MRAHGTNARKCLGPDENDVAGRGCRCGPCREASRAYDQEYRNGPPRQVDAQPVRDHLNWLRHVHRIGPKQVSIVTGLPHGAISKVLYGDFGRMSPPSARVRTRTAEVLLALTPADFGHLHNQEPAGPIRTMIAELVAAGVPKVRIVERLGKRGPGLQIGRFATIDRLHANIIRAMYAELQAGTLVTFRADSYGRERVVAPPAPEPRHCSDCAAVHASVAEALACDDVVYEGGPRP
jgi:hypothetical protein